MNKLKYLGTICFGNEIIIADPYNAQAVWQMTDGIRVMPGAYYAFALQRQGACGCSVIAGLICYHKDSFATIGHVAHRNWDPINCIGVDSGQAGIFDASIFQQIENAQQKNDKLYAFSRLCLKAVTPLRCGCLQTGDGIVSTCGYGEDDYDVFAIHSNNSTECSAIALDFGFVNLCEALRKLTLYGIPMITG